MSTSALLRKMLEKGLTLEDACELVEAMEDGFSKPVTAYDEQAERRRASDRERKRRVRGVSAEMSADTSAETRPPSLDKETPPAPPKEIKPSPLTPTNTRAPRPDREQIRQAQEAAGDALASMAVCPGVASLARLTALLRGDAPCDWEADVLPAIVSAAAWHRKKGGPGSMTSWETAAKIAVQNRDARLSGAPATPKGAKPAIERDDDFWRAALRRWRADPTRWTASMGPAPNEPDCLVPPHILQETEQIRPAA